MGPFPTAFRRRARRGGLNASSRGCIAARWAASRGLLVALLLVFAGGTACWGQAYTSQAAGPWNTATTWSPNGTPGAGDTVSIGHNITLAQAQSIDGITFTGSNSISGAFTLTLGGSATVTVNTGITGSITTTVIGGAAGLTKAGAGVLALSALNTYSGTTLVSAGTLRISGASGAINLSTQVTVADGATLDVDSTSTSADRFANGGTITLNGGTFSWTGAASALSETIGTLQFGAKHSVLLFTGNSATNTVTLNVNTTALDNAASRLNNATMEFQRSNAFLKASLTTAAILRWTFVRDALRTPLTYFTGTYDATNGLVQIGQVSGNSFASTTGGPWTTAATWTTNPTAGFPVAGDSIFVSGNGSLLGMGGTSQACCCYSLGSSSSAFNQGGTVTLTGNIYVNAINTPFIGHTLNFSNGEGVIYVKSGTTFNLLNQNFANTSPFTKTGPGTLTTGNAGSASVSWTAPVVIVQGKLALATPTTPLGASTGVTVYDGGALDLAGFSPGAIPLTLNSTGFQSSGALMDSSTTACVYAGTVTLASNSSIDVVTSGQMTISGAIGGGFALTKTSAGTLILSHANTYSGTTTATAGRLEVDAASTASAVSLNGTATLCGAGAVGTITTTSASSGTVIQPGTASTRGTLQAKATNLSSGTNPTVAIRIAGFTTAGTDYDRLDLATQAASITLGGSSKLTLDLTGVTQAGAAIGIVSANGTPTGTFATTAPSNTPAGSTVSLVYRSTGIDVVVDIGAMTTWTNGAGTGLWSNAGNWSNGLPSATKLANFSYASTANCSIDTSQPHVLGIQITSGYTGTITQAAANPVYLGASGFVMSAGGTYACNDTLYTPTFNQTGGTFTGSGTVYLVGAGSSGVLNAVSALNNLEVEGLDANLVGYWKMDGVSTTTEYDMSGNGHDATVNNSVPSSASHPTSVFANPASRTFDSGASADGLTDTGIRHNMSVADSTDWNAQTPFTVAAWVLPSATTDQMYLAWHTDSVSKGFNLAVGTNAVPRFDIFNGSPVSAVGAALAAPDATGFTGTTWFHVCGVWDGANANLYVDGSLAGSVACASPPGNGVGATLRFGTARNTPRGPMDDVRFYTRALSEAEVRNLYDGLGGDATESGSFTCTSNVTVNGNLKLYTGTLALGAKTLSVNGSATLYGQVSASTGILALTGTGSGKTLRCGETRIPNLTVNSSDGTGVWTLQDRLNVSGTLAIAAGQLDTGSNCTIRCGTLDQTGASSTLVPHASAIVVESLTGGSIKASTTLSSLRVESPIDSGLLAYWKFDTQSGLSHYDYSGNGHAATAQGGAMHSTTTPTPVATVFEDGGGATFDGVNDYMTVANSTGMNATNITISAWVKPSSVSSVRHDIVNKWGASGSYSYNFQIDDTGHVGGNVSPDGTTDNWATGATVLSTGTWYHVAMTYDGAALKIWLNGSLDGATQTTGDIFSTTEAVLIGHMDPAFAAGRWYAGLLDDVRIYNRALSPSEIRDLANGRYADARLGLAAYWKFDDQSGTTASDSSGYGLSATLSNPSMWTASAPGVSFTDAGGIATDGSSTYVTLPSSSSLNVPAGCGLTVSGWLKTTENYGTVLCMRNSTNGNSVIDVFVGYDSVVDSPGKLEMYLRDDAHNTNGDMTGATVNDGAWHHFALVRDGAGHLLMYQDGALQGTSSFEYPGAITTDMRYIGVEQHWATIDMFGTADQLWFAGSVDDLRFYKRALSATEIAALAAGASRTATYTLSTALATTTLGIDAGAFDANGFATTASGAFTMRDGMGTYLAGSATQTFSSGFTMSGGTFVGSSGTVAVTGDFTMAATADTNGGMPQSGGSFTAPSGTMTVTGSIAMGGGTFAPNGGTVQLNGGSAGKTLSGVTTGGGLYGTVFNTSLRSVTQDDWTATQNSTGQRVDSTVSLTSDAFGSAIERAAYAITGDDTNWDNFSFQWDGWITVPNDNTSLRTRSDDGSRVWIDANGDGVVQPAEWGVNSWGTGQGPTARTTQYLLPKGTYRIRVQYEEGNIGNEVTLAWTDAANSAGTTPDGDYVVPSTFLTPARGGGLFFNDLQVTGAGSWTVNAPLRASGTITCSAGTLTQASGARISAGAWSQSGGTFTGSGASTVDDDVTLTGDFSCSSGTFTATKGSLDVAGNFTVSGGTFAHNGGTVEMRPSGTKTITCTQTLNHLRVNDGLVAYWNFDEASSPALDLSGRGHDSTWYNAPTPSTTGLTVLDAGNSRAMTLNGTDQYLMPTRQTDFALPTITIAAWAYMRSMPDNFDIFDRQGAGDYDGADPPTAGISGTGLETQGGGWRIFANIAGGFYEADSPAVTTNAWHHVAGTCDGANLRIYVDGALCHTTAVPSPIPDQAGFQAGIGRNMWGGEFGINSLPGSIDELRVYDRALSATEIDRLAAGHDPGATANSVQLGSNLTLAGDIVLLSGTLDASPGYDIAVGGSWTNRGGAFTRGTRTVTLDGAGSSTIRSGAEPFYNLTLSGSGSYTAIDPMRARGALLQSSGTFVAPSSRLVCDGNLTVSGGTFTPNGGSVVMRSSSASTLTCTQPFSNLVLSDGLVAHWRCEEAASPSLDGAGYGQSGTWTNGATCDATVKPTLSSDNARSLSFDGVDDLIAVRDPGPIGDLDIANGSGLTIAAWAYANSVAGYHTVLAKSRTLPYDDANYALRVHDGAIEFYQWHGTDWDVYASNAAVVATGAWHHLAVTTTLGTGASLQMYLDGQAVAGSWVHGDGNSAPTVDERPLWIGSVSDGSGNPSEIWSGRLDDLRIYDRALAADDIARLASGRQPATGVATFTLGSNLSVAGDLTIASGTVDLDTRSVSVAGNWRCGGKVTPGSSTVTFSGSGVSSAILSGNQSLTNVVFGGTGTWTCSDWFRAGGTLTVNGPTVAGNARPMTVAGDLTMSAGALVGPASEIIACSGNVADAGGSTYQANAGVLEMTSASAKSLNVACAYNHLWIASAANNGLVARFRLDEAQAGVAVDDVSGIIARATNTPTSSTSTPTMWTSDPYCLDCSGATVGSDEDYLTVANTATLDNLQTSSYSLSAWFYPRGLPPATTTLDAFYGVVVKAGFHSGLYYDNLGAFYMGHWLTGNVQAQAQSTNVYPPNAWYQLCGVVDTAAGTTRIYVNGSLAGTTTWAAGTATYPYGATPWRIGIADPGGGFMWPANGLIDDVRFYSRALSAQEALALSSNGLDPANGGAVFTLAHAASIAGDVDLLGGNLSAAGLAIAANGSWRNLIGNAGFTAGGDTVTLSTTASQQIYGSTTFANLTKSVSTAATLTFPVYECQTVTGTLTLSGASGQRLSIRSSIPGSMATIKPTGTHTGTCSWLDVKDSRNFCMPIINPANSVDSGDDRWWFGGGKGNGVLIAVPPVE